MMGCCDMLQKKRMEEIDAIVAPLLRDYGYNDKIDGRLDVVRFARQNGFVVGNARLPDEDDGYIVIQPDKDKQSSYGPMVIGVNGNRDIKFKRFVIGHELGHWQLHHSTGKYYRHRDGMRNRSASEREEEAEADYFAAALLMPTNSFRRRRSELRELGLTRADVSIRLGEEFNVPLKSVLLREDELDVLDS